MFNLSTLSGINLQTDNYFQYTSNALTFYLKRKYVLNETLRRSVANVKAFFYVRFSSLFLCLTKLAIHGSSRTASVTHRQDYSGSSTHDVTTGIDGRNRRLHVIVDSNGSLAS